MSERDLVAARQLRARQLARLQVAVDHPVQDQELGAEALRLPPGEPRELRAADALDEAEEVLDHRRVGRLAARHVRLGDGRRQPVRGPVHGRREAGGSRADDEEVVVLLRRAARSTPQASASRSMVAPA